MKISRLACVVGAAFALTLFAACGGGELGSVDTDNGGGDGGDDTTPAGTYAEFDGKAVILRFDAPVSLTTSPSRAVDASNFSIAEDLTGIPVAINRMIMASDGTWAKFFGRTRHSIRYRVAWSGLAFADGAAVPDGEYAVDSPPNPMSLVDGKNADFLLALMGMSFIIGEESLIPPSEEDNIIDLMGMLEQIALTGAESGRFYMDPFDAEGCKVGSPAFSITIPQFQQVDYQKYLVGRVGTPDACQDIFTAKPVKPPPAEAVSVGKTSGGGGGVPVPVPDPGGSEIKDTRWSYLYFEDPAAGPVAEFVADDDDDGELDSSLVIAFPLIRPEGRVFDFNGDGEADLPFVMTTMEQPDLDAGKIEAGSSLIFSYYTYITIFFGGPGKFAGRISTADADVVIPIQGFPMSQAIYRQWTEGLDLPLGLMQFPYYPSIGWGNLDGDMNPETGKPLNDIAVVIYDSSLEKNVVKIFKGTVEGGVIDNPDSVITAVGSSGLYPDMIQTVFIANLDGDAREDTAMALDDLIVGITNEVNPSVPVKAILPEYDPAEVHILSGRSPWPASLSLVPLSEAEEDLHAKISAERTGDGYAIFNMFNIIADDYNNDGRADLVVGAPMMLPATVEVGDDIYRIYRGKVYLYLGEEGMGSSKLWDDRGAEQANAIFTGAASPKLFENDQMLGALMFTPGDMFNDGQPELLIAAVRSGSRLLEMGAAIYVFDIGDELLRAYGPGDAFSALTLTMGGVW
ncbi:MAG: hypothetical protein JXA24_07950 [Proteobacteria bacterium]|nr:hypothetical protein [Pseudomonadota bacterium]